MQSDVALIRRSLTATGAGALVVTLPRIWVERHDLKARDRVEIVSRGEDLLIRVAQTRSNGDGEWRAT